MCHRGHTRKGKGYILSQVSSQQIYFGDNCGHMTRSSFPASAHWPFFDLRQCRNSRTLPVYSKLTEASRERHMYTNTSTERHESRPHSQTERHSSQLACRICFLTTAAAPFVSLISLFIFCGSKPVSVTATRAISVRQKQIRCLMKEELGSWPHSD